MSMPMVTDDFIPLNQSTPVNNQKRWQGQNFQQNNQPSNWKQNPRRGGFNGRGNHSHQNSSQGNRSYSNQGKDKASVDAYLHPSMLQDPWSYLRRKHAESQSF